MKRALMIPAAAILALAACGESDEETVLPPDGDADSHSSYDTGHGPARGSHEGGVGGRPDEDAPADLAGDDPRDGGSDDEDGTDPMRREAFRH